MKLGHEKPVNKTAALVISKGTHYECNIGTIIEWAVPPKTYPIPRYTPSFENVIGLQLGRIKIIGYLGKPNKKKCSKWLGKCLCGKYVLRTKDSINHSRLSNATDMCQQCKKSEFHRTK